MSCFACCCPTKVAAEAETVSSQEDRVPTEPLADTNAGDGCEKTKVEEPQDARVVKTEADLGTVAVRSDGQDQASEQVAAVREKNAAAMDISDTNENNMKQDEAASCQPKEKSSASTGTGPMSVGSGQTSKPAFDKNSETSRNGTTGGGSAGTHKLHRSFCSSVDVLLLVCFRNLRRATFAAGCRIL